jgi:phage tail tape-measure protein
MVGARVGALVGARVGALVGARVGALVGARVGALIGARVGALVGARVGALVGVPGYKCREKVGKHFKSSQRSKVLTKNLQYRPVDSTPSPNAHCHQSPRTRSCPHTG